MCEKAMQVFMLAFQTSTILQLEFSWLWQSDPLVIQTWLPEQQTITSGISGQIQAREIARKDLIEKRLREPAHNPVAFLCRVDVVSSTNTQPSGCKYW